MDSSGSGRLEPPLVAAFLATGFSGVDSSALDRLDPLVVSFGTTTSSGDDSLDTGRLVARLFSFLTTGVLGFLAGAPLLTGVALAGVALDGVALAGVALDGVALAGVALAGVALAGVGVSFFTNLLTTFLAGDFLARGRPLPLAFDWLELRDFLAGGGRRALGGGLFWDFLRVKRKDKSHQTSSNYTNYKKLSLSASEIVLLMLGILSALQKPFRFEVIVFKQLSGFNSVH